MQLRRVADVPPEVTGMRVDIEQIGPFRILKRLGSRRQRVYAARHVEQQRDAAIKLIAIPPKVSRADALQRIHKEVRYLSRLRHPGLVPLRGAGVSDDKIYLEMEYIEGESLAAILGRRGRLEWDVAVQYAIEIGEVLQYLHDKNLTHSKLTPEKILISRGRVKVTDLRLNRTRRRRWDSRPKAELEVAAYLAPEQLLGEGATPQSDLYALGSLLFEAITGQLPYPPESLQELAARKQHQAVASLSQTVVEAPVWLDQVLQNLMHPDPRRRYPSASVAVLALRELQRIDAHKISAVAHLAGGFNPLTAGADKREARQLLGQPLEPPRSPRQPEWRWRLPLWAQVAGLGVGLLVCCGIIALTVVSLMPSLEGRISRGHLLLAQESPALYDLRVAIEDLERLLRRMPDDPAAPEGRQLVDELRTRQLLRLASRGRVSQQEPLIQDFTRAYQATADDKFLPALEAYRKVLEQTDPADAATGYLHRETHRQMQVTRQRFLEAAKQELAALAQDRAAASAWASDIQKVFGADPEHTAWVAELSEMFPEISLIPPWPL